jgi:thiosulfate/3-mercaptopyruvate sulfurtransferase
VLDQRILAETGALAGELGDPSLRVFDCTVILEVGSRGLTITSGRAAWSEAHIPGAGFLDLLDELSDQTSQYRFMVPPAEQFEEVMASHGVRDDTRIVLYDSRDSAWAARVWWMLRAYGFDNAAVLNGGWKKWTLEGRPAESGPTTYPRGDFTARLRPGVFVDRDAVLRATGDSGACIVNGLSGEQHRGTGPTVPGGRPGHIPGSVNVPAQGLVDPITQAYLPEDELRALVEGSGARGADAFITYCGGGIAASGVAFALRLLGHENVSIYDASLEEWATDPSLPIEVD